MATALILAKESYQVKKNCTDAERYAYTRNRGVKEFSEIKIIRECRCPNCKQILRHAGNVFRRIRLEVEDIYYKLPLLKCACGRRRGLIEGMLPHKHYGTDVILKVAEIVLGERKKEAASQLVHACLRELYCAEITTIAKWCQELECRLPAVYSNFWNKAVQQFYRDPSLFLYNLYGLSASCTV